MRKRAAIIVAIIVLASILAGCGGAAAPKEVKIGLIAPMSGGSAGMGINIQRGVTMAAEEINEKGGVKGMKLQIITEDDESNPVKAVNAIKKLIFNDKAPVVIGSNASSCTLAAMDEAAKAKVPLVTPTSSADNITQRDNKYIFRVTASNTTQANDLADYVVKVGGYKKIAIIYVSDDYGTEAKDIILKRLSALYNITPVTVEAYQPKDTDYSSQLAKVKAADPECLLFLGFYQQAALGAKALQQMGYKVPIFGLGALVNVGLIELAGEASLGITHTTMYFPEGKTEIDKKFIAKYQEKYKALPDHSAALAYDSMLVVAKAMKNAGSADSQKIRDELAKITDFSGVTGNFGFDATGDVKRKVQIIRVTGVNPPKREVVWPK